MPYSAWPEDQARLAGAAVGLIDQCLGARCRGRHPVQHLTQAQSGTESPPAAADMPHVRAPV